MFTGNSQINQKQRKKTIKIVKKWKM